MVNFCGTIYTEAPQKFYQILQRSTHFLFFNTYFSFFYWFHFCHIHKMTCVRFYHIVELIVATVVKVISVFLLKCKRILWSANVHDSVYDVWMYRLFELVKKLKFDRYNLPDFKLDQYHVLVRSTVFDDLHAFYPWFISRYKFQQIPGRHTGWYRQHADHLTSTYIIGKRSLLATPNKKALQYYINWITKFLPKLERLSWHTRNCNHYVWTSSFTA